MSEWAVAKSQAQKTDHISPARKPESVSPASSVLRLQRSIGNRALGHMVQTRLLVGPTGDRYEQEAEDVAEQVMGMHHEPAHTSETQDTHVQRACALCGPSSTEDDAKVRRLCPHCENEEESKARMSPRQAVKPPSEVSSTGGPIHENELRSGGDPMPDPVRHFFEARFSRDFRDVRVHTGTVAEHYNESLHSYGFTYGNHIWLGRGQPVAASLLMAHELAHVVQQHRPPRIRGGRALGQGLHQDREPVVRRFEPYWEPYDQSGQKNHDLILPAMGKANSIFTEAPVANARTSSGNEGQLFGFGKVGQVDLYRGSTTVGVYFHGHAKPVPLTAGEVVHSIMKDGVKYEHNTLSAPQVQGGGLVKSADAPKKIEIGDLKPNSLLNAYLGTFQLEGYKQGYLQAHKEAQDKATPGDGAAWNPLSVSLLGDLKLPDKYTHPTFNGQTPMPLVIKRPIGRPLQPKGKVMGNLAVWKSTNHDGIWLYAWVPTTAPTPAQLPGKIQTLAPQLREKIIDPLLESPVQPKKTSKPGPAPATRPALTSEAAPVIRRQEIKAPEKDTFDDEKYKKWKADRKEISEEYGAEKKTGEFKDAEAEIMGNRAYEGLRKGGLNVPEVPAVTEAGQAVGKLDFWTGLAGGIFGFFRKVFGAAFVKVAQFFIKMRDKVRELLKKMKTSVSVGGGFPGAALKAAFKGLKIIARFVIGRVVNRMMQSLITGVGNKIKAWIGPEYVEELEAKKEQIDHIRQEIDQKVTDTADQLLDKLFGVHIKDLEKLKDVYSVFQGIVTIVNLVRWGARVIACLSPPAFGCLWILAEAALDFAAQKVAETCWFQKKIQPYLAKVEYVTTTLPNMLGDGIIAKIKAILPDSVKDVFADLETGPVVPGEKDTECDEEDDHTEYQESPLHTEIDELYKKIGPERAAALSMLARKLGVPKDRPLTSDELNKLGDELLKVSPEQLRAYAEKYPAGTDGVPADFAKFVDQLKQAPASTPTTPDNPPTPVAATPPADDATSPASEDKGSGKSSDKEEKSSESGGGTSVVDGDTRIADNSQIGEKKKDVWLTVANPNVAEHTARSEPKVHVLVSWHGEAKVLMRNIDTVVTNRVFVPPTAKNWDSALALIIKYRMRHTYTINEVPGALIAKGSEIPAAIFTSQGQEYMKRLRERQAEEAAKK